MIVVEGNVKRAVKVCGASAVAATAVPASAAAAAATAVSVGEKGAARGREEAAAALFGLVLPLLLRTIRWNVSS